MAEGQEPRPPVLVLSACSPAVALEAAREAFVALANKTAQAPLRSTINAPLGATLFMPASAGGELGLKVVSVRPSNGALGLASLPATVMLFDEATGLLQCIMDATDLTAYRTAAGSALATSLLALDKSEKLAVFGAGKQAEAHVAAMLHVRPSLRLVHFVNRSLTKAQELAALCAKRYPSVRFEAVAEAAEALRGAQIVCTCTNSTQPLFDGHLVEPGTHINLIGSYTPSMHEVDSVLVGRCAHIVVDLFESVMHEAGDLLTPLKEGVITEDKLRLELGQVVALGKSVRKSAEEITLFKSCGNAVQDITVAAKVLTSAKHLGLGQTIRL